jgi:micrococcal nuclease
MDFRGGTTVSDQEQGKQEQKPSAQKASEKLLVAVGIIGVVILTAAFAVHEIPQLTTSKPLQPPPGAIQLPETNCTYFYVPNSTFRAHVIAVPDSDDIHVQTQDYSGGTHEVRVRLAEIDCPEFEQAYYDAAKQFITVKALNKDVTIRFRQYNDFSRYGGICRIVGWVMLPDGRDLSRTLLENGYAWHFKEHSEHPQELETLEMEARRKRLGLWQDDAPIPPWDFREMKRHR